MSGVLSFALFLLVVVTLFAIISQIAYKLGMQTRFEATVRTIFALSSCILAVIFALIAAYFHTSILFVFLGFFLLIIVIGAIAYFVFVRKL
jgi:hypothetical protein